MSELKTVTIDRAKWRRGGDKMSDEAGETELLNKQGFMDCLGFDAIQACGANPEDIEHKESPAGVAISLAGLNVRLFSVGFEDTEIATVVFNINDDPGITEKERERRLKKLARQNGRRYVFIGRTPPHLWRRKR